MSVVVQRNLTVLLVHGIKMKHETFSRYLNLLNASLCFTYFIRVITVKFSEASQDG